MVLFYVLQGPVLPCKYRISDFPREIMKKL